MNDEHSVNDEPSVNDEHGEISTGDPQVDAAVARLGELDDRDVDEHADVFDDIHGRLGAVLDTSTSAERSE